MNRKVPDNRQKQKKGHSEKERGHRTGGWDLRSEGEIVGGKDCWWERLWGKLKEAAKADRLMFSCGGAGHPVGRSF